MTGRQANNSPDIRFSDIRSLDGKQSQGFEELCVQLLPWLVIEPIERVIRVEGRGGDGGVEAIAVTGSGLYVGLQSKFFSGLGKPQWEQVDKSVKTAIAQHPELVRYLVCVPLERTPAQIRKWDGLVANWRELNPILSVEWVGLSELFGHLLKPDAYHLKTYWFSCPEFSTEWASAQTQVAIRQLHDRYTPQLHQLTSAEERLEFLTVLDSARAEHKKQCSELVIAWRRVLRNFQDEIRKQDVSVDFTALQATFNDMLVAICEGDLSEHRNDLVVTLGTLGEKAEQLVERIFPGEKKYPGPYWEFRKSSKLEDSLIQSEQMIKAVSSYVHAQRQTLWVLTGEAGSGKSHLLADLARKLLADGRACLLMVGERFATGTVLSDQIPNLLSWNWPLGDLLTCLSTHATITGKTAILMVDAINESPVRGLWRRELLQLTSQISAYPKVRLLVSCRTDRLDSSLPPGMLNEYNTIRHNGFDLKFHEAVQAYFNGYNVTSPQFPTLTSEFQNPLFLKTLCEAYQGKTLPLGSLTFVGVLNAWENRIAEDIERKLDCPQRATQRAVEEIVLSLAQSDAKQIPADTADGICQRHFSDQRASHSLYRHLNSEGLLQEIESQGEVLARLQYERFSDVRIAQMVLINIQTKQQWLVHWQTTFLPSRIDGQGLDWGIRSELTAYALLLPDAVGVEIVECPIGKNVKPDWARQDAKQILWDAWLGALPWRSLSPGDQKIPRLFAIWASQVNDLRLVWEQLFQFACIPDHPLNADYLHKHLNELDLPTRELEWTVPLAQEDPTDQTDGSVVGPFFYWADAAVGKASNKQVQLAAHVLLWLTSSPNRSLRDRATDVAIRLLAACQQAGMVCTHLLNNFWTVNDPYVKERLLAVMCGVLPRLSESSAKQNIEFVLRHFWQVDDVTPHILQREYAAFLVRHGCETGLISKEHLALLNHWPQKAKPEVWTEEQVDIYDKNPAYASIAHSLRPEEMGWYGDFGRYTMGAAVHQFADDERAEPATAGLGRGGNEHDARFARRYIWQRVIELGWTPGRFSEFERGLGYSHRMSHEKRIERISKKYQWIGLHEYLGHLSDALLYREWNASLRPLRGAWELYARDYQPECALGVEQKQLKNNSTWWLDNSIIPALSSVNEKRAWVQSTFQPFNQYLKVAHEQRQWVVLHAHFDLEEENEFGVNQEDTAKMSQWIDVRALLLPRANFQKRLANLKSRNFFGDGCDVPHIPQHWVTEYPWHHSFQELDKECLNNRTWFDRMSKKGFFFPVCEILGDDRRVLLPAPSLHRGLGAVLGHPLSAPLIISSESIEIFDHSGCCIVKTYAQNDALLIVDEAALVKYLTEQGLTLVWAVLSEKSAWNGSNHVGGLANQSAVYVLAPDGSISGGHTVGDNVLPEE